MPTSIGNGPQGLTQYEALDRPAWKQTLKDVPVAALASGIGYGVGRTVADYMAPRILSGQAPKGLVQALPTIAAGASFVTSLAAARLQGVLRERRDQARKTEAVKDVAKLEAHLAELKARHGLKVAQLDDAAWEAWGHRIDALVPR